MPTWGEIEREIKNFRGPPDQSPFDAIRRKYIKQLADYTKRSTIVYETAGFAPPPGASPDDIQISLDPDLAAFMEVVHGLPRDVPIDLILHSPGGTAEAAEAIIEYIRGRFPGLRVIVPVAAMSAATMMAMAADEVVMGAHSQLGPIDPQLTIQTPEGPRSAPAAAIRAQFDDAKADLATNPQHMSAWLPILRSLAPALLQICDSAEKLSKSMVINWLTRYMLSNLPDPEASARAVADALADNGSFMSHARRIGRDRLRDMGVSRIIDLEADQTFQDLVLSVHHAINHTMGATGMVKIVENHEGKAYIRRVGMVPVPVQVQQPSGGQPGPAIPSQPTLSRQQRRAQQRGGR